MKINYGNGSLGCLFFRHLAIGAIFFNICSAGASDYLNADYEELSSEQKDEWLRLLHYKNGKSLIKAPSTFFLSDNGNTDPKAEYEKNYSALLEDNDNKCKFPARYSFLTNGNVDIKNCPNYKIYRDNISIDNVYYVIANEVTLDLISQMGHSFILIDVTTMDGKHPRYIVSYAADTANEPGTLDIIWDFLRQKIAGKYFLQTYSSVMQEYVNSENRSLWKYRIKLTNKEKEFLTTHLYELKGHQVIYSLFDNNCANGAEVFFASSSDKFLSDSLTFDTPISYAQYLYKHDLIDKIQIVPSSIDQMSLTNNYVRNPLEQRKPSRIAVSYIGGKNRNVLEVSYAPIYKNMYDDNWGTYEISNNEVFKFTTRYDFRGNHLFLKKVDILNFNLIANGILADTVTKRFEISLTGNEFDTHTRLYPEIIGGIGYSYKFGHFFPYFLANTGIHFDQNVVFGIGGEVGVFVNDRKYGKFHLLYNQMLTNTGAWNGEKYFFEVGWSKLLVEDFSLDIKYRGSVNTKSDAYRNYFIMGFTYTF